MSHRTFVVNLLKPSALVLLAAIAFCASGAVQAEWAGGPCTLPENWPKSWPKELEPLRSQAWSWDSGLSGITRYDISFANREQFESAWPQILKLKTTGVPVTLSRGPHVQVWTARSPKGKAAGVRIFCSSPLPVESQTTPTPPADSKEQGGEVIVSSLELVVDGEIVDLNRIRLPADSAIIDKRFDDSRSK